MGAITNEQSDGYDEYCSNCWGVNIELKSLACSHFICCKCVDEIKNPFGSIDCPNCGKNSPLELHHKTEDAKRERSETPADLTSLINLPVSTNRNVEFQPCSHPNQSIDCSHCGNTMCLNCSKRHKEAVRSDILAMTQKIAQNLPNVRNTVDFRTISLRLEEDLNNVSCHIDEKIAMAMKIFSEKLFQLRDDVLNEQREQRTAGIANCKRTFGDFKQTKLVANDLKNESVFAATPFEDVIHSYEVIKKQHDSLSEALDRKEELPRFQNVDPVSFKQSKAVDESLKKKIELLATEILRPAGSDCHSNEIKICDEKPGKNTQCPPIPTPSPELEDWKEGESKGPAATTEQSSEPRTQSYTKLEHIRTLSTLKNMPLSVFMKPSNLVYFPRQLPNEFIVVHNTLRLSVVAKKDFEVLRSYRILPKFESRLTLNGDVAYSDKVFYVCESSRRRIFYFSDDEQASGTIAVEAQLLTKFPDRVWGIRVCEPAKELICVHDSGITGVSLTQLPNPPHRLITRDITTPYLEDFTPDGKALLITLRKATMLVKRPIRVKDGVMQINDSMEVSAINDRVMRIEGTTYDKYGNLLIIDSPPNGMSELKVRHSIA